MAQLVESTCQSGRHKSWGFNPWVRKILWRRKWQPVPVFLPGKSHGQRSLAGYNPWGCKRVGYNWAHTKAYKPNLLGGKGEGRSGFYGRTDRFLFFFWLCLLAFRVLVPQPDIEPGPSVMKAQNPNHWTPREFPQMGVFRKERRILWKTVWYKKVVIFVGTWTSDLCVFFRVVKHPAEGIYGRSCTHTKTNPHDSLQGPEFQISPVFNMVTTGWVWLFKFIWNY